MSTPYQFTTAEEAEYYFLSSSNQMSFEKSMEFHMLFKYYNPVDDFYIHLIRITDEYVIVGIKEVAKSNQIHFHKFPVRQDHDGKYFVCDHQNYYLMA